MSKHINAADLRELEVTGSLVHEVQLLGTAAGCFAVKINGTYPSQKDAADCSSYV